MDYLGPPNRAACQLEYGHRWEPWVHHETGQVEYWRCWVCGAVRWQKR